MNQILLASHGGLAAGIRDTVELIVGKVPNVHVLSTTRDETEPITVRAQRLLRSFDPADAVYILTDVMGGSVNNDMLTLLAEFPQATILCGTNACLALSLATADEPLSDGEIEEFLEEARGQIVNCNKLLRQAAENEEDDL
ncbi:MAG: PTS fructose transporter subunit IIA [Oscillibacter sp.]|nr:PTS fructose transporter subunit IIA [Oscillibacter sp.]